MRACSVSISRCFDSARRAAAACVLTSQAETLSALFLGKVDVVPLGRVELTLAGIVAPGVKAKASGGFDFPGYAKFRVDIVYLISRR